jgi:deazaflavin-dependent oxidoreductase (nitroreductase family)
MSEQSRRPRGRRVQASVMRIVNVPMRIVLGLPVATPLGKRLMLAFIVGRKTGKTYHQPLSYVSDDTSLLTPGGGKWKLNLAAGQRVRLRIKGRDFSARPEVVGDIDEVDRLLAVILRANPSAGSFVGIAKNPDGSFDRSGLQTAIDYGFRIVRWHLDKS